MVQRSRCRKLIRVEICGGIASGKTTLCNLLKKSRLTCVLENFTDNPFWFLFCKDPERHAFETEITFLLQHYSQVKKLSKNAICDFSLIQDLAYARVNLRGGRLSAFRAVYEQVVEEVTRPSLVVHLECAAQTELQRILHRQRREEKKLQLSYLASLNEAISFAALEMRKNFPILEIDSGSVDFANDQKAQAQVTSDILAAVSIQRSGGGPSDSVVSGLSG
jgi:deoxyguanosine kinase